MCRKCALSLCENKQIAKSTPSCHLIFLFFRMSQLASPQDVLQAVTGLALMTGQDDQEMAAQEDGVHEEPESAKNIAYAPLSCVHAALDFGCWDWWLHDP
jgi:hypothetical protein